MNTTLPLRRIRDFGEKVTDTFNFIKLNWKNLLVIYGLFVLPFLLVGVYLGAGYFTQILSTVRFKGQEDLSAIWKMVAAVFVIYLAVNAMVTAIYLYMKIWEEEDRRATPGDILKRMPGAYLSNLLYTILTGIGLVILMIPIFLLASGSVGTGSAVLIGLYTFCIMIGFLILIPFLVLIFPSNTIGRGELGNAFSATWTLLKGNWWSSLGYILVLSIIFYVFSLVVQLVLTMIFGAGAVFGNNFQDADFGKGITIVYGLSMLVQQIFYMIVFVGAGVLYYSLHEQKVGGGLEKMIDEMGGPSSRFNQQEEY